MMIPFLKQEDLILDNNRQIIPGAKIEVFDPVSNTHVNIYTYDGSNERYTVATNPVYLNLQSRPEHTYFADRLVLCRLYKYIGNFSDPRVDDDTNNWKFIREWNGAFQQDTVKNDTIIFGIESLAEANPNLGSVTVVGYWNNTDCEARTYVWDGNCVQTPDNGYIVKNSELDTGRWILKFDGEYLPSTYYGVYPGHEANINALLGYVESVGTAGTKTAPGVYFVPGTYDASTVALATAKKLLIDSKTSFTRESIQADDIKVIGGQVTSPICDFYFNENSNNHNISEAHSSWYKSVHKFLTSGAKKLIVDNENNFTDLKLKANVLLENKIIECNKRIAIDYNGCYIAISRCTIVGEKWIDANSDYIQFRYMNITDRWFTSTNVNSFDVGRIANGHHIEASSMQIDTLSLSNFDSAAIWLKWQIANGITEIDLEGRTVNSINYNEITKLINAKFTTLSYSNNTGTLELHNCEGRITGMTVHILTVNKSVLSFDYQPVSTIGAVVECIDSTIEQTPLGTDNGWKNSTTAVRATNCTWSVALDYTNNDNTTAQVADVSFIKCSMNQTNNYFYLKRCNFEDCVLNNQNIKIYPYKATGVDSAEHYYLNATFINNVINSTYPIQFTKYDDDNCYDIFFKLGMVGNNFVNQGITCRYWQNRTGGNYNQRFIAVVLWNDSVPGFETTEHHVYKYYGNIGNCPKENFTEFAANKNNFVNNSQWPSYNTCATAFEQVFPPLNQGVANSPFWSGAFGNVRPRLMSYNVDNSGDFSGLVYAPGLYTDFYAVDYENSLENGSLFNIGLAWNSADAAWRQCKEFIVAQ